MNRLFTRQTKSLARRLVLLVLVYSCIPQGMVRAKQAKLPILVHLDLTGDESIKDKLPSINAEVLVTLEKSGRYKLVSEEELSDNLIMGAAENLKFCDFAPACIASMGASVKAKWLLYGDVKPSFDGSKILVHLVLIDVPGEKLAKEEHGQFEAPKAAIATGDLLRKLLGLPLRKPTPAVVVAQPPPSDESKVQKKRDKKPTLLTSSTASTPIGSLWKDPFMWSTAGLGLACLATATTLGLLSLDKQDQAKALAVSGDPLGAEDRFHQADDMATGANILFGVGSAALIAGVVFFVLDLTDDDTVAAVPVVSCNSANCSAWLAFSF